MLFVGLCCCENWSLAMREKHRLVAFESKVVRKIFRSKRD